jgi:hypothetical protein
MRRLRVAIGWRGELGKPGIHGIGYVSVRATFFSFADLNLGILGAAFALNARMLCLPDAVDSRPPGVAVDFRMTHESRGAKKPRTFLVRA